MSPQRIQRKRTKGWRKPEGAVVVSRPSAWGNPFVIGDPFHFWDDSDLRPHIGVARDRAHAVALFERYLQGRPALQAMIQDELHGKDLCCWCPLEDKHGNPVPCHADVLLRIANEGA